MRLLVTRPQPEADGTAAALEALGHEVMLAPMLETVLLPPPGTLPPPAAVIFTSANAVRAVSAWPPALLQRDIPAFAVGDRTAAMAAETGFTSVRSAEGDSAALAALVEAECEPAAGPLLYPTIAHPAGDLAGRLERAGFSVAIIEAYRMIAVSALPEPVAAALAAGQIGGVLLYSRRTTETFSQLAEPLRPHLAALLFYCLSADVAAPLHCGRIRVAARPTEAALLEMLRSGTEVTGIR